MRLTSKLFAVLLAALCLLVCAGNAAAATPEAPKVTSAQAATMHLEKAQGTLDITDTAQKQVPTREGMQLYSGYSLETARESLAWISLDRTKAIKLAEESSALVKQDGRHLELTLNAGSLFFNITKPLEEDESLQIRTATIVAGIRGTSGWFRVLREDTFQVVLLDGSITVEDVDPGTNEVRQVTLEPGQILTIVNSGEDDAEGKEEDSIKELIKDGTIISRNVIRGGLGLRIEKLAEENVPEWIQEEVEASAQLQARIREEGVLSVPRILGQEPDPVPILTEVPSAEEAAPEPPVQAPLTITGLPETGQFGWSYSVMVSGSGSGSISCEVTSGDPSGLHIINANPVTIITEKPGTYTLTFTKAADGQYPAASITRTFTVDKADPRIYIRSVNGVDGSAGSATIPFTGSQPQIVYHAQGLQPGELAQVELTWLDPNGQPITGPYTYVPGTYTLTASLEGTAFHFPLEAKPVLELNIIPGDYPHPLSQTVFIIPNTADTLDVTSLFHSVWTQNRVPEGVRIKSIVPQDASTFMARVDHDDDGKTFLFTSGSSEGRAAYTVTLAADHYRDFEATLIFATDAKEPLDWDITFDDQRIYNGEPFAGYATMTLPEDYVGDIDFLYSGITFRGSHYGPTGDAPVEPGRYSVTVTLTGSDKYQDGIRTWYFSILPESYVPVVDPLMVTAPAHTTFEVGTAYDLLVTGGSSGSIRCQITDGHKDGLTILEKEGDTFNITPTKAGTYTLTFTREADSQYPATSTTYTFAVGKATPSIVIDNVNGIPVTDGRASVPCTGEPAQVDYTFWGPDLSVPGDAFILTWYSENGRIDPPTKPGTYTLTASLPDTDYHHAFEETLVLTLTIKNVYPNNSLAKRIDITPDTINGVLEVRSLFGESDIVPQGVKIESISGPDTPSFIYTLTNTPDTISYKGKSTTGTDTYTVTLASDDYNNFDISLTFASTKEFLVISIIDLDTVPTYDGTPCVGYQSIYHPDDASVSSFAYTGFTKSGTPYSDTAPPSDAGDYTVTVTFPASEKYHGATAARDFSILPKKIAPTVNVDVTSDTPDITVTHDGNPLTLNQDYILSYDKTISGSGTYTAYVSPKAGNYTFDPIYKNFTIPAAAEPAPANIEEDTEGNDDEVIGDAYEGGEKEDLGDAGETPVREPNNDIPGENGDDPGDDIPEENGDDPTDPTA